jgi:hypothetical protein
LIKNYSFLKKKKFLKKKFSDEDNKIKAINLDTLFFPFCIIEMRKIRYLNSIKKKRNVFSLIGIKSSVFLISKTFNFSLDIAIKFKNFEKYYKSKKPLNLLKKKFVNSSCFFAGDNAIINGSKIGEIDIFSFKRKNSICSLLNKKFPIKNLCNHPSIPSIFCYCQKNRIKFWRVSSDIKFLKMFQFEGKKNVLLQYH